MRNLGTEYETHIHSCTHTLVTRFKGELVRMTSGPTLPIILSRDAGIICRYQFTRDIVSNNVQEDDELQGGSA